MNNLLCSGVIADEFISRLYTEKLSLTCQKQPPEVFYKTVVLKNFVVFPEKHLPWSLC